jgi:hypothetical protein
MMQNNEMSLIISHLERIEKKVDVIDVRLGSSERIQVKQEANLAEHMKRSDYLEKHHEILRNSIRPVLRAYTVAWGICRIGVGVGILLGILKLLLPLLKSLIVV